MIPKPDTYVHISIDDALEVPLVLGYISARTMSALECWDIKTIREAFEYEERHRTLLRFRLKNFGPKAQMEMDRLRIVLRHPHGIRKRRPK